MENIADDPHNTGGVEISTPQTEVAQTGDSVAGAAPALAPEPQDEPEA